MVRKPREKTTTLNVKVDVEGVGSFVRTIELDNMDHITRMEQFNTAMSGLHITLAEAVLAPSIFEKYMEKTEF